VSHTAFGSFTSISLKPQLNINGGSFSGDIQVICIEIQMY